MGVCAESQFFYLPGRLRIKIPEVYRNPSQAQNLIEDLKGQEGISSVQINPVTGKALILFQEDKISLKRIKEILQQDSTLPKKYLEFFWQLAKKEPEIFKQGLKVLGLGSLLGYLLVKQLLFGSSRLSRMPFAGNLSTATTIITGYPIFRSGLENLVSRGRLNHDLLITIFTLGAMLLKENMLGLLALWLVNLTTLFQNVTLRRSQQAVSRLIQEKKTKTWLVANGVEIPADINSVQKGDVIVVHPGERILVDGQIIQGKAVISERLVNGTAEPILKEEGEWINWGGQVEEGSIQVRVEGLGDVYQASPLEEIIRENEIIPNFMADITSKYSRNLMGMSIGMAALTLLLTRDWLKSATILVIGSPSPAFLAMPTAMGAALGNAASQGVLIKKASHLQDLLGLETIFFDKTGTLTKGEPLVKEIKSLDKDYENQHLLSLAAGCERFNTHPLAKGIIQKAQELAVAISQVDNIQAIVGYGVRGTLDGQPLLVGSKRLLEENQVDLSAAWDEYQQLKNQGLTIVWIALNQRLLGLLGLEDCLKPSSQEAIQELRSIGIERIGLITGDNEKVADRFGQELNLNPIESNVLPEQKLKIIQKEQRTGKLVAMVGDGFNDLPALTKADLGITVGTGGTDLALKSADMILVDDDLRKIGNMVRLSQDTTCIVQQNFFWSAGINMIGMILTITGVLSPTLASVVHNLSTLGIVINSSSILGRENTSNSSFQEEKEWINMNKN